MKDGAGAPKRTGKYIDDGERLRLALILRATGESPSWPRAAQDAALRLENIDPWDGSVFRQMVELADNGELKGADLEVVREARRLWTKIYAARRVWDDHLHHLSGLLAGAPAFRAATVAIRDRMLASAVLPD
ncbi:hypothetical protein [uncultured Sphingomonas sp.]|uniref:hypothetical protein n=1 Tax=uncultured Sphingomonas sp. TaxID=158754 RepID=UPI0035CB6492